MGLIPAITGVLGSRQLRRPMASFRDTRLTGIMSESKIDMRESHSGIEPVRGRLELFVVMGSVEIHRRP